MKVGLTVDGNALITEPVEQVAFGSGSIGYQFNGKVEIAGKKYQVGCTMTEIHSKGRLDAEAVALREAKAAKVAAAQ